MSSLRVRAQNKLLNKLGAAKPSKNVQFDNAFTSFERAELGVLGLESALRGFIVSLKGFHVSAQVLYGAIEAIGGTSENSPEMKEGVAELKSAFFRVDVTALEDSIKNFENYVMQPTAGWMAQAASVKNQVAEFNEEKLVYDHYTRKVMSLREARDKRSASGKQEKPKDVEKIVRNEQKLAATTNTYSKISDATITNLRDFVNSRETKLAPIVQRVVEFRLQYAARIADESRIFQKMIQDDSVHLTGGGRSKLPEQANSIAREPEPPVQALSFESFVGEAPPHPPSSGQSAHCEWVPPDLTPLPKPVPCGDYASAARLAIGVHSPTSPGGASGFFDECTENQSHQVPTTAYHPAPVQLSSPSVTPWDDISLATTGTHQWGKTCSDSSKFTTVTSPTAPSFTWDEFDNIQ